MALLAHEPHSIFQHLMVSGDPKSPLSDYSAFLSPPNSWMGFPGTSSVHCHQVNFGNSLQEASSPGFI